MTCPSYFTILSSSNTSDVWLCCRLWITAAAAVAAMTWQANCSSHGHSKGAR